MNLDNTVIECLTPEHGKRIIKFYKDNGYDTSFFEGSCSKKDGYESIFYGYSKGFFSYIDKELVDSRGLKIIELPEEFKNGDKVLISDDGILWTNKVWLFVGIHPISEKPMVTNCFFSFGYETNYLKKYTPEVLKPNFQKEINELIEKAKKEGVELTVKIN